MASLGLPRPFRAELLAKQGKLGERSVRVVAVRDVTERERASASLRESEARLRDLALRTFDLIVFSRDGVVVAVHGALEKTLGFAPEDLVGQRVVKSWHRLRCHLRTWCSESRSPAPTRARCFIAREPTRQSSSLEPGSFQGFLRKPFSIAELIATIEGLLAAAYDRREPTSAG
jgi:PAS domain-containing protein